MEQTICQCGKIIKTIDELCEDCQAIEDELEENGGFPADRL